MSSIFQLRKDVFDYLKANISDIAEIVPEHPTGNLSTLGLAKVVVTLVRDSASGRYISQDIENPEIQLTVYAQKELQLTKPNGVLERIINTMPNFQTTANFHKVRDAYIGYVQETLSYCGYLVYRFYLKD